MIKALVSEAVSSAVRISDCKADLRIENNFTQDDNLIFSYIDAAAKYCSEVTGRKLINETHRYSIQTPKTQIKLPYTPVQSIQSISYYDSDNTLQSMSVDDFFLYTFDQYSEIQLKPDSTIPSVYNRKDAFQITFVTGYGERPEDLPLSINRAIRLLVVHWYENRSGSVVGVNVNDLPFGINEMLGVERTGWAG